MNSRSSSLNFRYYYVSRHVITHTFAAWFKSRIYIYIYIYLERFGFTDAGNSNPNFNLRACAMKSCNKFRNGTFLPFEEKGKWRVQWWYTYSLDGWKDRQRYCPCGKRCFRILSYSLEFRSNDSNLIWLNLHKDNYWNYDKSRCDYYNAYNDYIARYCVEKNPGNCSLIACIEGKKNF